MKKSTKFNKLFPKATNIELNGNGFVWGIWFNETPGVIKKTFYPIEFQPDEDVLFEEEIITATDGETISKICLN